MKLEVGMYVRTKDGYIGKLNIKKETITVPQWAGGYKLEETTQYFINDNRYNEFEITKASHNIIGLIEVGDYVNGEEVLCTAEFEEGTHGYRADRFPIKSIVTHEQFNSIKYEVK